MRQFPMILLALWCASSATSQAEPTFSGRALSSWIDDLSDANPQTKTKAATVLRVMGLRARRAVPALIKALEDRDPYVRQYCAGALGVVGRHDPSVLAALRRLLADEEWFVRSCAVDAVGKFGPAARPAAAQIEPLLKERQPYVRIAAARALWRIDQRASAALPVLVEVLKEGDTLEAGDALNGLEKMGPAAAPAVADLRAILNSSKSKLLREAAVRALGSIGPAASNAIPDLLAMMQSQDRDMQLAAWRAMADIGRAEPSCVTSLIGKLSDPEIGYAAGQELGSANAVAALVEALKCGSAVAKENAAAGLAVVRGEGAAALPALLKAMEDTSPGSVRIRRNAIKAVGAIGPDDPKSAEQLLENLRHERDSEVLEETGRALRGFGPAAVPVLGRALNNRGISRDLRCRIAEALSAMGPDASPAATELLKALQQPSGEVCGCALGALANCGSGVPGAAEAIAAAAEDRNLIPAVCHAAFQLGPQLKPAVPRLASFIRENPASDQVEMVAQALLCIGVGSQEVVKALRIVADRHPRAAIALWRLGERDKAMLDRTIEAFGRSPSDCLASDLGSLGADAKAAQPALERMLTHPSSYCRIVAALALWRIDRANAPRCVESLLRDLDEPTFGRDAAKALGEMGPDARRAAPALADQLVAAELEGRVSAAQALYRIDRGQAPFIVEVMVQDLSVYLQSSTCSRSSANLVADALGDMAADAMPAIEVLQKTATDPDPDLRRAAVRALRKIEKSGP
jgi:HEAT repeat protein